MARASLRDAVKALTANQREFPNTCTLCSETMDVIEGEGEEDAHASTTGSGPDAAAATRPVTCLECPAGTMQRAGDETENSAFFEAFAAAADVKFADVKSTSNATRVSVVFRTRAPAWSCVRVRGDTVVLAGTVTVCCAVPPAMRSITKRVCGGGGRGAIRRTVTLVSATPLPRHPHSCS